jgi:glycosyltransferase involved in cell wall biosynthesis
MKVALYNLHFATMGGGERRTAALAAHLRAKHEVMLFVLGHLPKKRIEDVFGIEFSGIEIVALERANHFKEIAARKPDLFINNSHASALRCPAPLGIYMCMFPRKSRFDLSSYHVITANSQYTASWIERLWGYKAEIVYSACMPMGPPAAKEKTILNVGRFFANDRSSHHKMQHILLNAFIDLTRGGLADWRLHLVGNVRDEPRHRDFVERLRASANGYPVQVSLGIDFDQLRDEYRRASIYWHGTGFGASHELEPGKHEHFGMSIVEAMSAGAVPLAYDSGGPGEIIRTGVNGFLWKDLVDLKERTIGLIASPERMRAMASASMADSEQFDVRSYLARMDSIIARLAAGKYERLRSTRRWPPSNPIWTWLSARPWWH